MPFEYNHKQHVNIYIYICMYTYSTITQVCNSSKQQQSTQRLGSGTWRAKMICSPSYLILPTPKQCSYCNGIRFHCQGIKNHPTVSCKHEITLLTLHTGCFVGLCRKANKPVTPTNFASPFQEAPAPPRFGASQPRIHGPKWLHKSRYAIQMRVNKYASSGLRA